MTPAISPYFATPMQPRPIWSDRDKSKAAAPLPTQTVEIIRPFYHDAAQGGLDIAREVMPENRLTWINDNPLGLPIMLQGDGRLSNSLLPTPIFA